MTHLRNGLARTLAYLLAVQPILTAGAGLQAATHSARSPQAMVNTPTSLAEPRELTGTYVDSTAEMRERGAPGMSENGGPLLGSPIASLPIVDEALTSKIRNADKQTPLRVIVHLDFLPHAEQFQRVISTHGKDIDALETERVAFGERQKALRATDGKVDAENYAGQFAMSAEDSQTLRAITQRHEALSLTVKNEAATAIRTMVEASQAPLKAAIGNLGGNVEFTTIAGNLIIATLVPDAIEELANEPGVLRIVEDSVMEGHLNTADASAMVDPSNAGLLGLWDNAATGGIYDPAIIDSGLDMAHPGMQDNAGRTNFSSWYVVAGVGSAAYNETCCTIDDIQGHGTHVAGIVGSYGTGAYPGHLGMSHGVEKLVTLKAGWLNNTNGGASMFWSDKYNLVDRALYNTDALSPANSFADDVDGMNLSYGGSTSLDDTDGGRFWDSVISTYPDLPVTISAGNSGPSNTLFSDPAVSYNAIAVAAADDRDTSSRTDDIIASYSTRGPTANSRKKPDIAAPGTDINAPNTFWESQSDYVDKDGTSMAAPMVLGVIMDLMDAALFDEKALKAVLINTAQKNSASMNIESDSDGWDPAIGWGYMNAYAAYHHRFDYFIDSVQPRLSGADEYQLYKGTMQDEGSGGEGRDRATMVWNRPATYNSAAAPTTYYNLSDLNLRLYQESDNFLIDSDLDGNDNVHQVRVGSGAQPTDVIINAYAWSTAFDSGATSESFALATEEGFVRVERPTQFQGIAVWPTSVEPNETFDIEFWLRNDSEIASHNNNFDLALPAGWTLVAGSDIQDVGSAASGGNTAHVFYTIRVGPTLGAENIAVAHSHNSYNVPYGNFNWNMGITVEWDNTAPSPDPMSFSTLPFNVNTSSISMTASFASDSAHNPVEYYLDYTSSPTGGGGAADTGWQSSRSYTNDGLFANHEYCYRAWAQDSSTFPNLTTPSDIACTYTSIETPAGIDVGTVTTTSVLVKSSSTPSNLTFMQSGLRLSNDTTGANSGFVQNTGSWNSAGLTPAALYSFSARARNGDGDETSNSPTRNVYTLANPPAVDGLFTDSQTSIKVSLNPNGNSNAAEYLVQNTTNGMDSGWITDTSYLDSGLTCDTQYSYQAKARNGDGIESIIVPLGIQTTDACFADTDNDGVIDSEDNCTVVANPLQRDTDTDGYGNFCDPDLNQDLVINFIDLGLLKSVFFSTDPDADFNGDGAVNFLDLSITKQMFFAAPGPSGLAP